MPYQPHPTDLSIPELIAKMREILAQYPLSQCYPKWTCPACGDRVTANTPNQVHTKYVHEQQESGAPCGAIYTAARFGLLLYLNA